MIYLIIYAWKEIMIAKINVTLSRQKLWETLEISVLCSIRKANTKGARKQKKTHPSRASLLLRPLLLLQLLLRLLHQPTLCSLVYSPCRHVVQFDTVSEAHGHLLLLELVHEWHNVTSEEALIQRLVRVHACGSTREFVPCLGLVEALGLVFGEYGVELGDGRVAVQVVFEFALEDVAEADGGFDGDVSAHA